MAELGMRQRELTERSQVSQAIVREIQRNTVQRQRSARTLEALSIALDWHPQHLAAVLAGRTPPKVDEPVFAAPDDIYARLDTIERLLRDLVDRFDAAGINRDSDQ
jgi:DNA-binding Xre family transcriptional regulator